MVNDYISQTFDILKKGNSVVVKLRDVLLMNDISKHLNKRLYEIGFGRDLYTEYHVNIQRNPCFGLDEDIASAKAALDGISKSYTNLKSKFGSGVVTNKESFSVFKELKDAILKQYPRKDSLSACPDIQQAWQSYNAYSDSIAAMTCRVEENTDGAKALLGEGVSERMLLAKARQIDTSVARWLLSADPIERRDIITNVETIIKNVNAEVTSQGVYTVEQRQALAIFREAERYFRYNCLMMQ